MLILDEGFWNGWSCFDRGMRIFAAVLATGIPVGFLILVNLEYGLRRLNPTGPTLFARYPQDRRAYGRIAITTLILALIAASITPLLRTRSLVFVENGFLVESSCRSLAAHEDRFAMKDMRIFHSVRETRGGAQHWLNFEATPQSRRISIHLPEGTYDRNLVMVAPEAMRTYRRWLLTNSR